MIIGVTGLIGSGKDTIADYLCTKYDFVRFSFASSLKDAAAAVFNWDRDMLEGLTPESRKWREEVDEWWSNRLNMPHLTPRWVLQYWGTDVLRNHFHEDIWVASIENKLRKTNRNVVITDCRFSNEVEVLKKVGGITIRVNRGPAPEWYNDAIVFNKGVVNIDWTAAKLKLTELKIHPSEYSSVGLQYDHTVDNNGTLTELYNQIDSIVNL